jgi:peptide/nickel transport system permease protein
MRKAEHRERSEAATKRRPRVRRLRALVKNKLTVLGGVIVIAFLACALIAPSVAPYKPTRVVLSQTLRPPSGAHWFGTDDLGRDILSRVLHGSRLALLEIVIVLTLSAAIGIPFGLVAGFSGGKIDELMMRLVDLFLSFPTFILALAIASALGPSLENAMIALGISWWPWYARIARGQTRLIKQLTYVEAAHAMGSPRVYIMLRHILPNILTPILVQLSLDAGYVVLTSAALSFVGLGAQPPTPDWGLMVAAGRDFTLSAWWLVVFPGVAIALATFAFNLLGDGLRDFLDPRTTQKGFQG